MLFYPHSYPNTGAAGNNVALTIMKRGQLGVVLVSWATGLPGGSLVNGSITPSSGSILMEPEESDVTIELTVSYRTWITKDQHFTTIIYYTHYL